MDKQRLLELREKINSKNTATNRTNPITGKSYESFRPGDFIFFRGLPSPEEVPEYLTYQFTLAEMDSEYDNRIIANDYMKLHNYDLARGLLRRFNEIGADFNITDAQDFDERMSREEVRQQAESHLLSKAIRADREKLEEPLLFTNFTSPSKKEKIYYKNRLN